MQYNLEENVDNRDPEFGIQPTGITINMYDNARVKPAGVIDLSMYVK